MKSNLNKSLTVLIVMLILSLQGCNEQNKNPINGLWKSVDNPLLISMKSGYKKVELKITDNSLTVLGFKTIPIVFKSKKDKVIMFSRGERMIAHLVEKDTIVLFIIGIGKRRYKRVE